MNLAEFMDRDVILGCIVIIFVLIFMTYLVFKSKRIIEFISREKNLSLREIVKKLHERR